MSKILQVFCVVCLVFMSHGLLRHFVDPESLSATNWGSCFKENTGLPGGIMKIVKVRAGNGHLHCNSLCRETAGCVATVLFRQTNCQLKDSTYGPPRPAADTISAVIADCDWGSCFKENTDLPGGIMEIVKVRAGKGHFSCNSLCRDTAGCVATVLSRQTNCQLKDSTHGPPRPAADTISAVIADCDAEGSSAEVQRYSAREAMKSWRRRILSCRTTDTRSKGVAYQLFRLIGEKFDDYTKTESPQVVEKNDAEQQKEEENAEDTSCHFKNGTDLPGGTIRLYKTEGATGCRERCSDIGNVCVGYTFLTTINRCKLKKRSHGIASYDNWDALEAKAVSGLMSCACAHVVFPKE